MASPLVFSVTKYLLVSKVVLDGRKMQFKMMVKDGKWKLKGQMMACGYILLWTGDCGLKNRLGVGTYTINIIER